MVRVPAYVLVYDAKVALHVKYIEKKYHHEIKSAILEQLKFQPLVETKNRKPLRVPNSVFATWELRIGNSNQFRVFYAVEKDLREVQILAIGTKVRNILSIAGEVIAL